MSIPNTSAPATTAPVQETAPSSAPGPTPAVDKPPAPAAPPSPAAKDWAALRAQEERIRREREELKGSAKELEEARKFRAEVQRLAKENPEEAAKLAGLDYNSWTRQRLTPNRPKDPVAEVRSELEKLKADAAAKEAAAAERAAAEQTQAVEAHWKQVRSQFSAHVSKSGEKHEFLRSELEADPDEVIATLQAMAEQKPDLTIEEAADLYERHLSERVRRFLGASKAKSLLTPADAGTTKPSNDPPRTESGNASEGDVARTLTNSHAQERSTAPLDSSSKKSALKSKRDAEDERIRRAMAHVSA